MILYRVALINSINNSTTNDTPSTATILQLKKMDLCTYTLLIILGVRFNIIRSNCLTTLIPCLSLSLLDMSTYHRPIIIISLLSFLSEYVDLQTIIYISCKMVLRSDLCWNDGTQILICRASHTHWIPRLVPSAPFLDPLISDVSLAAFLSCCYAIATHSVTISGCGHEHLNWMYLKTKKLAVVGGGDLLPTTTRQGIMSCQLESFVIHGRWKRTLFIYTGF